MKVKLSISNSVFNLLNFLIVIFLELRYLTGLIGKRFVWHSANQLTVVLTGRWACLKEASAGILARLGGGVAGDGHEWGRWQTAAFLEGAVSEKRERESQNDKCSSTSTTTSIQVDHKSLHK